MKIKLNIHIVFLLLIISINKTYSQLSDLHYIPPLTSGQSNAVIVRQYLYISTPESSNVDVQITPIGGIPFNITVSNSSPYRFDIDNDGSDQDGGQLYLASPTLTAGSIINNKGYIIQSSKEVYAGVRVFGDSRGTSSNFAQAGAMTSKGKSALGTSFKAGMPLIPNTGLGQVQFISIMATIDNTNITFENLDPSVTYAGTVTSSISSLTINLNRGESYILAASIDQAGVTSSTLIGTSIVSNKEIVVNSGAANSTFGSGPGRDFGFDQIVPVEKVGKEYVFTRGAGGDSWENALLVATEDNTEIYLNGNLIPTVTLNKNEFYIVEGNFYNPVTVPTIYVRATEKIYAFQGIGGTTSEVNQGMFFVPPLSCLAAKSVDNIPDLDKIGNINMSDSVIYVIARSTSIVRVTDNNNTNINISALPGVSQTGVQGNANYIVYKVTGLEGNVSVLADDELYVSYVNQSNASASGAFYSGFTKNPEINLDKINTSEDFCLPNVNLVVDGIGSYDSFSWWYDDKTGGGFSNTGVTTSPYSPSLPGKYKVIAQKQCGTDPIQQFESKEVTVSVCPTDFDSDGVADNIDLDVDNDGIFNITESLGIVSFDLLDIINPIINFSTGSSTTASVSTVLSLSSSNTNLVGNNSGNVTSTVGPGGSENTDYQLTFSDEFNFILTNSDNNTHTIVSDESFRISVGPNTKTLTLLDLDNRLLVDTNFDGIFESGVTSFTANEFLFKYNPSSLGNPGFSFSAREVREVNITHLNESILSTSTFGFKISLKDFPIDTDGDLFYDYKDLDSDDDSCYDTFEAGFSDPDNNGRLGSDPITLDYLGRVVGQGGYLIPLDADSNSIFDFQEATTLVSITSHPISKTICVSDTSSFSVVTSDPINSIYQWQIFNGSSWDNIGCTPDSILSTVTISGDFTSSSNAVSTNTILSPIMNISGNSGTGTISWDIDVGIDLAVGEEIEKCELVMSLNPATGKYIDDGLIFIVDGVTIIDFSQNHYDSRLPANPSVVAFNYDASSVDPNNGIFDINMNGYWESWAGEGNPSLEISSGTIKLMLDTRSGEREDALPYMDQTVPGFVINPGFQYDCKNGFNLIFGNQNGDGTGGINADLQVKYTFKQCGYDPSEANYTGVNSSSLTVQPLNTSLNGKKYRVKTRKLNTQCETISDEATINVFSPSIVVSPTAFSKREDDPNMPLEISLTGTPSSDVYLDFVNIDTTEIAVNSSTLTFTPLNWNVTQTILIDPQLDFIVDGDQNFNLGLSVNTTSTLNCYNSLSDVSIPSEIIDIDQPGFTLVTIDNLTDESGDEGSFSIVMNSKPSNFVDLVLTSSDLTEGSVQATVTFSPLNWNIPQIITVTGLPDPIPIQDGSINYQIITGAVSSTDAVYNAIDPTTIDDVAMINQDLNGVGVELTVLPDGGMTYITSKKKKSDNSTSEDGNTLVVEFNLTTLPLFSADVTIPLSISGGIDEVSLSTSSVTILNANWNTPSLNKVIITGLDDDIIDGDIPLILVTGDPQSSDSAYDNLNATDVADVDFINVDNDNPGFLVGPISNDLDESGNQAYFFVMLSSRPNTTVVFNISTNDSTEAEVDASYQTIAFNPAEWNIPQNVYLNSVNDDIIDGDKTSTVLVSVDGSSDPNFVGLDNQSINVVTIDDDESNILITEIDLLTSEDGDQGFFEVRLTSRPDSPVTVSFSSSNLNEGNVIPEITFNSSNWDQPQLVHVTGIDDFPPVTDGPQDYDISVSNVFSLDLNYGTIDPNAFNPITFTNQDNDSPAVIVKVMNDDYTTSEDLESVVIGFKLTSEPLSWVDIPVSIGINSDEVVLADSVVRIEKENWDDFSLNQVVITGADDLIIDGNQTFEFITGNPTSLDLFYGVLNADDIADVNLVNQDNDFPFLNISEPEILSEDKNSTNISISLGNQPTGKVKIVFELTDVTEVTINKLEIEFDEFNWNFSQEIILYGVDDPFLDGDIQSNIILKVHSDTEDINYLNMESVSVELVTLDNEKDSDSDGTGDDFDNCPDTPNPDQKDFDGDGIGDTCDDDIDGDGVLNITEIIDNTSSYNACSFLPISITLPITVLVDCDLDDVYDKDDIDDDNDGILDILEGDEDIDGDGLPNSVDIDSDNDGCFDTVEAGFSDDDNDGVLGTGPVVFDSVGRVLNQGGYTQPIDRSGDGIPEFKQYGEELLFTVQPTSKRINDNVLEIESQLNISGYSEFRWQENTGTDENPSWKNISNDPNYSGWDTNILRINNLRILPSGRKFRVVVGNLFNACYPDLISDVVTFGKVDLFIPNAFSPDGDGVNDTWEIAGIENAVGYKLIIFNRWGIKVFETNNYKNDWAGASQTDSFISKDNMLPEGTYFYSIIWGDQTEPTRGYVYIKRRNN